MLRTRSPFKLKLEIPYRGKLRRGKVTKFSSSDENFLRRKFSLTKLLPRRIFFPNEYFTRWIKIIDMSTLFCEIFNTLGVETFASRNFCANFGRIRESKKREKNFIDWFAKENNNNNNKSNKTNSCSLISGKNFVGEKWRNFFQVTKIIPDENFPRQKFSPTKFSPIRYAFPFGSRGKISMLIGVFRFSSN